MRNSIFSATCACLAVVSFSVNAVVLEERLGGLAYYDRDADLTWLANSNLATTETFGVDGIYTSGTITATMNLETANNWISAMNDYVGTGYLGINSWRLPKTITPDSGCTTSQGIPISNSTGFNCTNSEMGHLFYNEFGGIAGEDVRDNTNPAVSLFSFPVYPAVLVGFWSGTQPTTTQAFVFGFNVLR